MASAERAYVDPSALRSLYVHDDRSVRFCDLASDLSERYTARLGTRSLDVLHVATAITLGMKQFVTYDERQGALAKATGMKVLAP